VESDDDIDRGKLELDAFLKNPGDLKYGSVSVAAQKLREDARQKEQKRRAKYVDVRTNWTGRLHVPAVTIILIMASVLVTLGTNSLALERRRGDGKSPFGQPRMEILDRFLFTSLINWYSQNPLDGPRRRDREDPAKLAKYWWQHIQRGEVWRLITPIFPHLGILHLLFNMLWLRDLGTMIETRRGNWRMLAVVLPAAVLSNFGEYFWSGPAISAGMSGVVYALFGYIWIKQRFQPQLGLGVREQVAWMMTAWLFICMLGWVGQIANAAHVVGLIVGALIAYGPIVWQKTQRRLGDGSA
jgi:GlpG protein